MQKSKHVFVVLRKIGNCNCEISQVSNILNNVVAVYCAMLRICCFSTDKLKEIRLCVRLSFKLCETEKKTP